MRSPSDLIDGLQLPEPKLDCKLRTETKFEGLRCTQLWNVITRCAQSNAEQNLRLHALVLLILIKLLESS